MLIMKYCRRSKPKHLYSGSQIILNAFLLRTYMYIYTVFLFKKKNYKISIKVKGYSTNLAKPLRTRASMKLIVRSINDTSSTKTFPLARVESRDTLHSKQRTMCSVLRINFYVIVHTNSCIIREWPTCIRRKFAKGEHSR